MIKEPTLTFVLSNREMFHCSYCRNIGDEGAFVARGTIRELITAFEEHVEEFHSKGEDFSRKN